MRQGLWVLAGLIGVAALAGCQIAVTCPPPPPGRPSMAVRSPSEAEIDAAGRLEFESSRLAMLDQIAQRHDLDPRAQWHLVGVAYHRLDFEASKVHLLTTLIQNPRFANASKQAILDGLSEHLDFESSRVHILNTIQQKGELEQ